MKAVVFREYGPPEVLETVDLERPRPDSEQVLVRVRAAGVQPFDTGVRRGWTGFPVNFPQQIGNEFAGVVAAVGDSVSGFAEGDEVLGWVFMSALAEYVVVGTDAVVPKPAGMGWEIAGSLSASGQTAYTALRELGVGRNDTVLVHAAAGGVGTVAIQLARAWGATVIGTASEANHDYLDALGAIPVTYGEGLAERVRAIAPHGVDAVIDGIGGQALRDSRALVGDAQRIGTLVDHDLAEELGARGIRAQRSTERLTELVELHQADGLRLHVRAAFPLEHTARAHHEVESGHGRGKVVVTVGE